ncbi:MAG: ABC transporter permease, partial [Micrococcales bacterium]|nr:ABC transporter permease [Micrococcales bacterium]
MSTETKKETRESWKTPIVMGSLAAVVLVFFGILGKPESVAFELTGVREAVQLPNIDVASNILGIASGILLLAIAGFSAWQVAKNVRS